jgi:hypothetical protein
MEYLKKNLDNSLILPYDIMLSIYEYADYFCDIRRQIENKECDLQDIMYNRMKKYITTRFFVDNHYYMLSHYDGEQVSTFIIGPHNIDDIDLKDKLLNWYHGYKHYFLWKSKKTQSICGIETHFSPNYLTSEYFKSRMEDQIKLTNNEEKYIRYDIYNVKQIYKMWINL